MSLTRNPPKAMLPSGDFVLLPTCGLLDFIRPGAGLSGGGEGGTLGDYLAEIAAEGAGETAHEGWLGGGEVVSLADVGGNIEKFLLAGVVVVDEFPVALTDGATKVNAGAEVAPHVGEVPHEGTAGLGVTAAQEGREGLAVDGLRCAGNGDVRHVEERGIEVFYHHVVRGLARGRLRDAGPPHDEGHADATLTHGTLAA